MLDEAVDKMSHQPACALSNVGGEPDLDARPVSLEPGSVEADGLECLGDGSVSPRGVLILEERLHLGGLVLTRKRRRRRLEDAPQQELPG